ncbi:MAG: ribonuclease HII [Candidatus Aenigmatarchaeota archaeon]
MSQKMIIGVDEVGRGAFAGPVVACAVYLPPNTPKLKEVTDSKLLPEYKRNLLSYQLKKQVKFAISCRPAVYIDKVGIFQATMDALREAVLKLVNFDESKLKDFLILVDGKDKIPYLDCQQKAIVKGDQKIYEISAASIIAKVFRDNLMKSLSQKYPLYQFDKHKGYGTPLHRQAISKYGKIHGIHRFSFIHFK